MMKKIAIALTAVGAGIPVVLRDVVGLTGLGLISYGAWMITPPAGYITAGVLMLVGVILISAKKSKVD
jgi:hypothetical protein